MIYDAIRKKYVLLTPEEWVRQHVVNLLVAYLHYPKSLVKLEGGHRYNTRLKRTDVLVFANSGQPLLLVECKAAHVKLTEDVCRQLAVYNNTIQAPLVAITNGLQFFVWRLDEANTCYHQLSEIPDYRSLPG